MVAHPTGAHHALSVTAPSCLACLPAATIGITVAITFQEVRSGILL
jgi:hypothetical protein